MRTALISAVLALQSTFSFPQETRVLDPDSLQNDFTILGTTLKENHPMLFLYISARQFDSISNEVITEIKNGITSPRFYHLVSTLLSRVGCGHTYAYPSDALENRMMFTNDLPFEVAIHDEHIYISKAHRRDYEKFVGKKIDAINNVSAPALLRSANAIISSDGYNVTYKRFQLRNRFNYYTNLLLGNPDSLVFELPDESFTVNFPTGFINQRQEKESTFYDLPGSNKTVVLSLVDFDEGRRLIRKCFRHTTRSQAENLVIDLRNNGGGNGNIGAYLTSFIVDSTTTYYLDKKTNQFQYKEHFSRGQGMIVSNQYFLKDSITKSYYFKVHPRKKYNFNGNLFVLVNGGTFSTGAYVSSVLKNKTQSTFVGEETGGSEYAIGAGMIGRLTLPYSQIAIKFPMHQWRFNSTYKLTGRGVIPDMTITNTATDATLKADKELEAVIELISIRSRQASSKK